SLCPITDVQRKPLPQSPARRAIRAWSAHLAGQFPEIRSMGDPLSPFGDTAPCQPEPDGRSP
ncbi:MAG: hypothetical protein PVG21_02295, partial [Gammaproteobacteria bacterium]